MAAGFRRIWEELLLELQDRIVSFLEPNEVACTVRLICKAAAVRYYGPQHTRVRLSQPVPTHAFARRWGRADAMRSLSYAERDQLLCLTAASGSTPNLQLLLPVVGCALDSYVFAAAASAGHLATCQWMRHEGCHCDDMVVAEAVGSSGSWALWDWLTATGCHGGAPSALEGAASAGHMGLVDQLLASYSPPLSCVWRFLAAGAQVCDLPTLRRLYAAVGADEGGQPELLRAHGCHVLTVAAGSPTTDWREKVEWLEAQGCSAVGGEYCQTAAARCPDALDRLSWLAQHGWQVDLETVALEAAGQGSMQVLRYALEARGKEAGLHTQAAVRELGDGVVYRAASNGHLAALQHLHSLGCSMEPARRYAACHGHLHVVAWLVETLGAEAVLSEEVFQEAARSGSLPLLTWLRERGCVCRDASVLTAAVERGASEEALEWLLAQGCSMQLDAEKWVGPARRGDLATLAWLRRMGCPWPASGSTFMEMLRMEPPFAALRWLAEAGCPVDWAAALAEARACWRDREAVARLAELRAQHAGQQQR